MIHKEKILKELNRYRPYEIVRRYGNTVTFARNGRKSFKTATIINRKEMFLCSTSDGNERILDTKAFSYDKNHIPLDKVVDWVVKKL